ncbi:hypothetical protein GXP76_34450, partial [Streptomyces sp. NP-1717]|nr:hypothetical protein [Streptomyces sp. NP-1717]
MRAYDGGPGWKRRREQCGEAVGQQGGRVARGVGEVRGQGAAYGVGRRAALQPGGDAGRQAFHVALGEQQARVVAP